MSKTINAAVYEKHGNPADVFDHATSEIALEQSRQVMPQASCRLKHSKDRGRRLSKMDEAVKQKIN